MSKQSTSRRSFRRGRERIKLANGDCLDVDYVILTSGHTDNLQPDANPAHFPRPYPVGRYVEDNPGRHLGGDRGSRASSPSTSSWL